MPTETKKLPCRLTQLEKLELGRELARYSRQLVKTKAEKTEAMADFNAVIKDSRGQVARIADQLESGAVEREVEVEWKFDWRGGRKVLFRCDTHEMIDDQPLTDEERQGQLFLLASGGGGSAEGQAC